MQRATLGPQHPRLIRTLNNLGGTQQARGELRAAMESFREALRLQRQQAGEDHPRVLFFGIRIDAIYNLLGEPEAAEGQLRERLGLWRDRLGMEHGLILLGELALADALLGQERWTEAEPLLLRIRNLGNRRRQHDARQRLLELYQRTAQPAKAEAIQRQLDAEPE